MRTQLTKNELEMVFKELNPHKGDNLELRDFEDKLNEIKEMPNIELIKFINSNEKRFRRIFKRMDSSNTG